MIETLQDNSVKIEEMLVVLRQQLQQIRKHAVKKSMEEQMKVVEKENKDLKQKVAQLKQELISAEIANGVQQVALPDSIQRSEKAAPPSITQSKAPIQAPNQVKSSTQQPIRTSESLVAQKGGNEEKKQKAKKNKSEKAEAPKQAAAAAAREVDVSMLDMRVGRVVAVKKHPDADSLYVEEVDVGEASKRSVVSGLVAHVPIEQMQNRLAVFLLNLKPAKMRGVVSQGMIMCASTPEKVEVIEVPEGVAVGDRVVVDGFPGDAEEVLNPKKKWWENIQPDLRINPQGVASYKDKLWQVVGKGGCFKAPSLKDTPIK